MRLELSRGSGAWHGRWEGLGMVVFGDEVAPSPAHLATLTQLVGRFAETKQAIEAFAAALVPDGRVPLQAGNGHFAASDCGFDGDFFAYQHVAVTDLDRPEAATIGFYTGLPDGYVTFEAKLEAGRPVAISAYCS